jgi:hypothetical protein
MNPTSCLHPISIFSKHNLASNQGSTTSPPHINKPPTQSPLLSRLLHRQIPNQSLLSGRLSNSNLNDVHHGETPWDSSLVADEQAGELDHRHRELYLKPSQAVEHLRTETDQ